MKNRFYHENGMLCIDNVELSPIIDGTTAEQDNAELDQYTDGSESPLYIDLIDFVSCSILADDTVKVLYVDSDGLLNYDYYANMPQVDGYCMVISQINRFWFGQFTDESGKNWVTNTFKAYPGKPMNDYTPDQLKQVKR